jgi:hypothetical protein
MSTRLTHKSFTLRPDWASVFASQVVDYTTRAFNKTKAFDLSSFKNPLKNFPQEKIKNLLAIFKNRLVITVLILAAVLSLAFFTLKGKLSTQSVPVLNSGQTNFSPQNQIAVNRKFEIPIRSSSGTVTGEKLSINLSTIDKSNKILIQGKPATARAGKTFVILNLEIDNSTKNQLTVRPVDFIRLQDSEGRSFASDVHNEAVKAEAVSTKRTRVGFVVDENQKSFKFLIGEITGEKQTIEVSI